MGLFSQKKTSTKDSAKKTTVHTGPKGLVTDRNLDAIIINPRVTEKAVGMSEQNVYTFVVRRDATKFDVRDAIKALYSVTPVKVNIVNKAPAKRLQGSRNRMVHVAGIKKAYVYLKKGDTINLV